jgi:hypothetical protein
MENKTLENMRYCVEPVHPMAVRLYSDLVTIYRFVKDNYQKEIDAAFDRASQQIGFVVTTTVPVMLEVGESGAIKSLSMGSESLKNTPFEKEIPAVFYLKKKGENKLSVSPGVYNLALFWYEAVKLRLRTDWMEPAQPVYQLQSELMGMRRSPQSAQAMSQAFQSQPWMEPVHHRPWCEPVHTPWTEPVHHMPWMEPVHTPWTEPVHHMPWMEPVHPHTPWMEPVHYPGCRPWLEPAHPVFQTAANLKKAGVEKTFEHTEPVQYLNMVNQIIQEKTILVSAIDEVYPELKLGERLNKAQYAMSPTLPLPPPRASWPGVREPAHMMALQPGWSYGPSPEPWRQVMAEIAQVLERYGPRPEPWKYQFLSEIASVLGKYSYGMLNPQPLPPGAATWPGVREPAHMMAAAHLASNPNPSPWSQAMGDIAQVVGRYGPQPDPWKDQIVSEIASVLGRYSYGMLNPQPLPPRYAAWPGVKEPAHPMSTHPWWSSDPAQMAALQPEMSGQILSEIASVLRRYGIQR